MGSGCSCRFHLTDGPVRWYQPDSLDSHKWQMNQESFGQGRNKSFFRGLKLKSSWNRRGNEHGQLGGKVVFYDKAIPQVTNYGTFIDNQQVFTLHRGQKLFCKAFFKVPLGRMPIGENNIPQERTDLKGQGPVLLAACPKVVALFVKVDGKRQKHEFFCEESAEFFNDFYGHIEIDPCPVAVTGAIKNSFLTFMVSRAQDPYFFLHIPMVATFYDSFMDIGSHGIKSIQSFIQLFSSLTPGKHKVEIKVKVYFDHCDYNYFPMDKNINARGLWYDGLQNSFLRSPHHSPQKLIEFSAPVARGCCVVDIPGNFASNVAGILDRKPPLSAYPRKDIEIITSDAKSVAASKFAGTAEFGVEGLPDVLILTSDRKERKLNHKNTGYRYRFEYVDFTALWLNKKDQSDDAYDVINQVTYLPQPCVLGSMIDGCMARGEIKPRQMTKSWAWHPPTRQGEPLTPEKLEVRNKYIRTLVQVHRQRVESNEIQNKKQ